MQRTTLAICLVMLALSITACSATPSAAPTQMPITVETIPPDSSVTAEPTQIGGAPEAIFVEVGSTATFSGQHDVSGKAVVAGLQTLIILVFQFDGKVNADIRLVKGEDYANPVHTVAVLDRSYDGETLQFPIPATLTPGSADTIAVYDTDAGQVLASAVFH